MEERRSVSRWQINREAELSIEDGNRPIPCVVEDISPSGMCVSLCKELFPDVFSNFNLTLGDNCEFNAGARVAWSDKAYERNIYGLDFHKIEDAAKDKICQYVKDNFPTEIVKHWWEGT